MRVANKNRTWTAIKLRFIAAVSVDVMHLKKKDTEMKNIFPEPIRNLPEADIPLIGVKAFLSQAESHQIIFMEFEEDVDLPEHSHAAQVGIVIEGKIDLKINEELKTYKKGDMYYIPAGTKHSGKIYSGYTDITFFNEPNRYKQKSK